MKAFWNNHGFSRMRGANACAGGGGAVRQFEEVRTSVTAIRVIRGLKLVALIIALFSMGSAVAASATTPEFRPSIKHDGVRASAGEETLRYSPLWDGGSNETAQVTLKQGDAVLSKNLTAEGDYVYRWAEDDTFVCPLFALGN